jgi:hypothetical protein
LFTSNFYSRAVRALSDAIINLKLNEQQQVLILQSASEHPQLRCYLKSVGLIDTDTEDSETTSYMLQQMRAIIQLARQTENIHGRPNNDDVHLWKQQQ